MLKLAVLFVLAALGKAADEIKWETIPEAKDSAQCIYRTDTSVLACRGSKSVIVECPTSFESGKFGDNRRYEVFGMARVPGAKAEKLDAVKFFMHPRASDNQTYFDHKFSSSNGQSEDVFLYSSENPSGAGFRVHDLKCYEKMVALFEAATVNHPANVNGENVSLFGEILYLNKPSGKRWLGWLSGWGLGPWGWLGGWGFPWFGALSFPWFGK